MQYTVIKVIGVVAYCMAELVACMAGLEACMAGMVAYCMVSHNAR
jgi:hypothetical protein